MKKLLSVTIVISLLCACQSQDLTPIESRLDALEKVTIQSIQSQIITINSTLTTLQSTQAQLSGFVTTLQTSVGTLEGNYASINTAVDNLGKQDEKFEKDIADLSKAVEDCGKDVQRWVEESYTTLTKFSELKEEVSTIKTNIQAIFSRLDGLDSETKIISDGLRDLSTELNEKLGKCEGEIEGIKKDLKALQDDMDSVKAQITAIVSSVQSVVVVPDYSDGSVKMTNSDKNLIRFEIYPLEAGERLAELGKSAMSLDCIETKSSEEFVNLPITSVSFFGKTLLVAVDGTGVPEEVKIGLQSVNARLLISDGVVTRSSEYFHLSYSEEVETDESRVITGDYVEYIGEHVMADGTYQDLYLTFNGWTNFEGVEGASVVYGIEYSGTDLTTAATVVRAKEKDNDNNFSCTIYPTLGGHYYYRAYARHDGITKYGEIKSMYVSKVYESIEVDEVSKIGPYQATISGTVHLESNWAQMSKLISVFYWEEGEKDQRVNLLAEENGQFSVELTQLKPSTKYCYEVDCNVQSSWFKSEQLSFETADALWYDPSTPLNLAEASLLGNENRRLSIAFQNKTLFVSQDSNIYSFNTSGKLTGTYSNLPVQPEFITNDDAGNIIIASRYNKDSEYEIYGTSDLSAPDSFWKIASGTVGIECDEIGNFKVKGDVTNKAVISGLAVSHPGSSYSNKYVVWEIENGKCSTMSSGNVPSSVCWSSYFGVVHPLDNSLESGLLFSCYGIRDGLYYSKDCSLWNRIISWDSDENWRDMQDNMCVIDYNGKKHLVFVDGQAFTYSHKNLYIYNIDNPNYPVLEQVVDLSGLFSRLYFLGDSNNSNHREDITCQVLGDSLYIFVCSSAYKGILCVVHTSC